MIQSIDIQEAALQLWNASTDPTSGLAVTVPGGLHFGRVPEKDSDGNPVASPYASYSIRERAPERTALRGYLQAFIVEVRIYGNGGGPATGEISRTLDDTFDFMGRTLTLTNGQVLRLLHGNRQDCELKEDEARLQAGDVLLSAGRYEWLCQGTALTPP